MTEVIATAKYIRMSPQKVRLVLAQIKKMKPQEAVEVLDYVGKKAAMPLKKSIASAIANAKHNFNLDEESLAFKSVQITGGRMLKRWRPVSRGRAHQILRRTSYIRVVLEGQEKKTNKTNTLDKSNLSNKKAGERSHYGSKS